MSCSVQLKTRSTVKSKKVNNVIHRTTSETIRLGEPEVIINNSSRQVMTALAISPPPLKKSTCSFQVTGVSLTQRTTDFGGDDSADDLDESHTDDISRVTDNETPSFSEDTCSRDADDNYIGSCSALCSVTVIPSSSQYGLAIVPSETTAVAIGNVSESSLNSLTSKASASTSAMSDVTETQTPSTKDELVTTPVTVPSTGAPIKIFVTATYSSSTATASTTVTTPPKTKEIVVTRNSRFPGTRFEVVKVESIQPFRRGRWYCMDYLDDSKYTPKNALTYKSPDSPEITCTKPQPQYTMTATTTQINPVQGSSDFGTNFMNSSTNQGVVQQNVPPMTPQQGQVYNAQVNPYYSNIVRQSQSYSTPISVPTQQLHHGQIDVMQTHNFVRQTSVPEPPRSQVSNFALQNQYFQNLPTGATTAMTVQQPGNTSVSPQQPTHSLQQPISVQQSMTLPCQQNQGQLMSGDMYGMQNSQVFYAQPPTNQPVYISQSTVYVCQAPVYVSPPQIATSVQSYTNLVEPGQNQPVIYSDQVSGTAQTISGSTVQQNYTSLQVQGQSTATPTPQQYNITTGSQNTTAVSDSTQIYSPGFSGKRSDSSDSHSSGKTSHSSTRKSSLEPVVEDVSLIVSQAGDVLTSSVTTAITSTVPIPVQGTTSTSPSAGYGAAATVTAVQSSTSNATTVPATVSAPVIAPAVSDSKTAEARYKIHADFPLVRIRAANNTSAIIDTKIEQAMDLVKSHLMYTVREEVEVLKVRIAELLDRINQLEMENSFLKANASPEVLNALNSRAPQDQAQGNGPSIASGEGGTASK